MYNRKYVYIKPEVGSWFIENLRTIQRAENKNLNYFIKTNSLGMRSEKEYSIKKDKDINRIILLGDSFTFGTGVHVYERFSDLLESNNQEILNFGFPGSGTDHQLLVYENIARSFEADTIMICPHSSNIERNMSDSYIRQDFKGNRIKIPKPYFNIIDNKIKLTKSSQKSITSMIPEEKISIKSQVLDMIRASYLKYLLIPYINYQPYPQYSDSENIEYQLMKKILERLIENSDNRKVVIAPLPGYYYVLNESVSLDFQSSFKCFHNPQKRTYYLNILPFFHKLSLRDRRKCFISVKDQHYSSFGNKIVSHFLSKIMQKFGLING